MKKSCLTAGQQDDLKRAVEVLKKGGVILYPTDTVWGIGCDATNERAVERVFAIKHRREAKALITLVGDFAALERTVDGIPDVAYDLIEFSDKPLTIIYDRGIGVAPNVMADDGSLGVRMTFEPFSQALCRMLGRPLVSTSANVSDKPTPKSFKEISAEILENVDYVCSSRTDEISEGKASTIMRLSVDGSFKILRP